MEFNASEMKELNAALTKAFGEMQENLKKVQDTAAGALEEVRKEGTLHGETNKKLTELGTNGNKLADQFKEVQTRMLDVEQKLAKRPAPGADSSKSWGDKVIESDQFKAAVASKQRSRMDKVDVGSFHIKAPILGSNNPTAITQSPIVSPDVRPGIIMPGLLRMTIRNLLAQNRTSSNLIVFAKELLYTSAAGPQGGPTSPIGLGEGEPKSESSLTFTMANVPVITLAHWIPASEQVLDDAPMLQGYVDGRLRYGLMLEEEKELLNGDGSAGTLDGLVHNATAFTGGATNQTALDTILKAFLQISLSYFEPSGIILHPVDWTDMQLLKDTLGRYLFSNPQGTVSPTLWGKPVVATPTQTQGQFLAGAFNMACEIFDRWDATVEISKEHADFFIRNMVAILCEERLALAIYRSAALVKGALSYKG